MVLCAAAGEGKRLRDGIKHESCDVMKLRSTSSPILFSPCFGPTRERSGSEA